MTWYLSGKQIVYIVSEVDMIYCSNFNLRRVLLLKLCFRTRTIVFSLVPECIAIEGYQCALLHS